MKRNRLNREDILRTLFQKIQVASYQFLTEEIMEEELPTAASLAREFDLRLDEVKKRISTLREEDLIQCIGANPKRYRINVWRLKMLEKESDYPFEFLFHPNHPKDNDND